MPPTALPLASIATTGAVQVLPLSADTAHSMLPLRMNTAKNVPSSVAARWGWIAPPAMTTAAGEAPAERAASKSRARIMGFSWKTSTLTGGVPHHVAGRAKGDAEIVQSRGMNAQTLGRRILMFVLLGWLVFLAANDIVGHWDPALKVRLGGR